MAKRPVKKGREHPIRRSAESSTFDAQRPTPKGTTQCRMAKPE